MKWLGRAASSRPAPRNHARAMARCLRPGPSAGTRLGAREEAPWPAATTRCAVGSKPTAGRPGAAASKWYGEPWLHPLQPAHRWARRRLRPTGKGDDVQVLWWRREAWGDPAPSVVRSSTRRSPRVHRQRELLLDPRLMTPVSQHVQSQAKAPVLRERKGISCGRRARFRHSSGRGPLRLRLEACRSRVASSYGRLRCRAACYTLNSCRSRPGAAWPIRQRSVRWS